MIEVNLWEKPDWFRRRRNARRLYGWVLTWLIDHEVEFDYGVGISAGAMNLCSFAMRNKQYLYDVGVIYMPDKRNVGLNPLLKERHYVGYDFMFDRLLKETIHYELDTLRQSSMEIEIGLFNLNTSKVEWVKKQELDDDLRLLKGACTLPLAGSPVPYRDGLYMDGGVTTMVPISVRWAMAVINIWSL
ncbi:MAG: hypothetical protein ACLSA6_06915 [Holdemania massiliensis]